MPLNRQDLFTLAKTVANAKKSAPVAYSYNGENFNYQDLNETLRSELLQYAGTYADYRENQNLIFRLIEETIDDVLPKRVLEAYGQFAEVKTFAQGDKPIFIQRISTAARRRAKQFVTKVGLAGVYEVFKLDGKTLEIATSAYGGAAQIGFEEFLDGRIDFADVLDIITEGLDECIYIEIERALEGAVTSLPAANQTEQTSFREVEMDKLISIADSYGGPSTIYCTFDFAATMVPEEGWASNDMKEEKWKNGYLGNYKGHRVIVLPNSYEDETNSKKVIDPAYAWVIPTGGNDKPIKIAFEGQTAVREWENKDWSREIQTYKKFGVGALVTNNICVYKNTALTR